MTPTIHPETEIVASRFDPATRQNHFTIARDGRRWTVMVPADDLDRHGVNRQARRSHVAFRLAEAMRGKADGER